MMSLIYSPLDSLDTIYSLETDIKVVSITAHCVQHMSKTPRSNLPWVWTICKQNICQWQHIFSWFVCPSVSRTI